MALVGVVPTGNLATLLSEIVGFRGVPGLHVPLEFRGQFMRPGNLLVT